MKSHKIPPTIKKNKKKCYRHNTVKIKDSLHFEKKKKKGGNLYAKTKKLFENPFNRPTTKSVTEEKIIESKEDKLDIDLYYKRQKTLDDIKIDEFISEYKSVNLDFKKYYEEQKSELDKKLKQKAYEEQNSSKTQEYQTHIENQLKMKKMENIFLQIFFLIGIFKLSSILIKNKDKISTLNKLLTSAIDNTILSLGIYYYPQEVTQKISYDLQKKIVKDENLKEYELDDDYDYVNEAIHYIKLIINTDLNQIPYDDIIGELTTIMNSFKNNFYLTDQTYSESIKEATKQIENIYIQKSSEPNNSLPPDRSV